MQPRRWEAGNSPARMGPNPLPAHYARGRMAFFDKPTERHGGAPPRDDAAVTLIGPGTRLEGTLTFDGEVHVEGTFAGQIICRGTVVILAAARVQADVDARAIVVHGEVE